MVILANSGVKSYGIKSLLVNTKEERDQIDVSNLYIGSDVYVTKDSELYILNSNREWDLVKFASGGGGGAGGDYDGGDLNPGGGGENPKPGGPDYDGGDLNGGGGNNKPGGNDQDGGNIAPGENSKPSNPDTDQDGGTIGKK